MTIPLNPYTNKLEEFKKIMKWHGTEAEAKELVYGNLNAFVSFLGAERFKSNQPYDYNFAARYCVDPSVYTPNPDALYRCVYCNEDLRLREADAVVDSYKNVVHYKCFLREVKPNIPPPSPANVRELARQILKIVGEDLFDAPKILDRVAALLSSLVPQPLQQVSGGPVGRIPPRINPQDAGDGISPPEWILSAAAEIVNGAYELHSRPEIGNMKQIEYRGVAALIERHYLRAQPSQPQQVTADDKEKI
jgi:hypothetical protein